jgi:chitosanase
MTFFRKNKFLFLVCVWGAVIAHAGLHDPLSPQQRRRAMQMTSYFENSTIDFQYDYIENIHDGRGYTVGRIGFTSATGDLADLIHSFCDPQSRADKICSYESILDRLAQTRSADTTALGPQFLDAWKEAARTPAMRQAQDLATESWYYQPAIETGETEGLKLPLSFAVFYDSAIEHGPKALQIVVNRTNQSVGTPAIRGEKVWLQAFLEIRRQELLHPKRTESQEAWAESVPRVVFYESLIQQNNWNLVGPLIMDPDDVTVKTVVP